MGFIAAAIGALGCFALMFAIDALYAAITFGKQHIACLIIVVTYFLSLSLSLSPSSPLSPPLLLPPSVPLQLSCFFCLSTC